MKTSAIVRIIIYSLLILILIGIMGGFIADEIYLSGDGFQRTESPVHTESLAEINQLDFTTQVQNIEIVWVAGSITIHPSDSISSIHVEEYAPNGTEHTMVCRQSGQTLKIEFSEEKEALKLIGNNHTVSKDLVIRVPKNWNCNNLEIDAAATDVTIQDLTVNELDFDGASGKLILDNCNIVDLDIDTASGDVDFNGILKDLEFDAASAKFYGDFRQVPNHLNMDTASGDLEIVLPEYCWFTCELDALSSRFETDFATTTENGIYIHGGKDNACHIKISALSGDVSILKGVSNPQIAAGADTDCTDSNCTDPSHGHNNHH